MLHVGLFVDQTAVQNIIERRTLAMAGLINRFLEGGEISAPGFAGGLEKELGHVWIKY
jgi:hypothetical protein